MIFIINGLKYDTDKMKKVADVKKWYQRDNIFTRSIFPGQKVGRTDDCELWKSKKGSWLLTRERDYGVHSGEAIEEAEAKELLMQYAINKYEKEFGKIPDA
jgi:hypothetical protein